MSVLCKLFGHKRASVVLIKGGDLRSRCVRCGRNLVRYGHRDWRGVDIVRAGRSVQGKFAALIRKLRCRAGLHVPTVARWHTDPVRGGYHLSACRHCDARLVKEAGERWRRHGEAG